MSRDVLDLIDSVLDDYATSCDAMRWAPDAADPTPSGEVVPFAQVVLAGPLPPGQEEFLRAEILRAGAETARPFVAALEEFFRAAAAEFARFGEQIAVVFDEIPVAEAKRARLRRMHTDYRRRNRGR